MKIVIDIKCSYSNIQGLTPLLFKVIRNELSYEIDSSAAYFSKNHFNTKRYLMDKKGTFPTGLINDVLGVLYDRKVTDSLVINDHRKWPQPYPELFSPKFKVTPYASQQEAAEAAMHFGRGTISMPTGTGKSLVIALIIARLSVKTLIVVPTLEIKKQLIESLQAIFGDSKYITVENIDSAALKKKGNYECLIIDEAHHVAAKTYHKLNETAWTDIAARFFLTATPWRNNSEETLLFKSIAGELIYKLSYKDAITQGYIVPVEAFYIELPKIKTNAITWQQVYSELVVNSTFRNNRIADILHILKKNGRSTLCLVKEIKHGNNISDIAQVPFVNGQDEVSRDYIKMFNDTEVPVLVGTEGIISEGIDTKPCEYVIIAALGKAKSAFMQKVGRAVRKFEGKKTAKIILILDRSHRFCLKHYNEQVKILKDEYGITPKLLTMEDL